MVYVSYQGLVVVLSFGVDTNDHFDFSFSVKIVLEQMGYFWVSVGNHLREKLRLTWWSNSEYKERALSVN